MLVEERTVRREGGLMLLDIPRPAISRIICGPRAVAGTRDHLMATADRLSVPYVELQIGKTSPVPHFRDRQGRAWLHRDGNFVEAEEQCARCKDPISKGADHCSLCRITDHDLANAARRNPYRLLHRYGMLPSYMQDVRELDRRRADAE